MKLVLALALAALCCVSVTAVSRKIAAFNIQVFGTSKAGKPAVMDELCQILKRYDIVVIQEIRNKKGTAIVELLDQLNADSDVNGAYTMDIGPRVGRTSSKEQYAYFYRDALFQVLGSYSYDDYQDIFEREPYQAHFRDKGILFQGPTWALDPNYEFPKKNLCLRIVQASTARCRTGPKPDSGKEFMLSALHTKPDDAVAELDYLTTVYADIGDKMGTNSVMFLGDFNADCSYVRGEGEGDFKQISLWTDRRFKWYIGNDEDTTVSSTDCAYDRFVTAGEVDTFVDGAAKVFNFELEHELSNSFAKEVSDHYPVEITLTY